jgi:hypothetical protein
VIDSCLNGGINEGQNLRGFQTKSSHFTPNQADKFVVNPSLKPAFLKYLVFQN